MQSTKDDHQVSPDNTDFIDIYGRCYLRKIGFITRLSTEDSYDCCLLKITLNVIHRR